MANYIAAKLGVKVELVPVTTANRIPYLQTRKADLVISTLGKNPEREKVIDFTAAYSPFYIAVFAPKAMAIKTPADLAGKSIGVTRGSVDDMELTKVAPAGTELRRFEDNNATVSAYTAGQVQLVATSAQTAGTVMAKHPQLNTEFKFTLKDSPNFIGVGKGEDKLRRRSTRSSCRRQEERRPRQDGREVARTADGRPAATAMPTGFVIPAQAGIQSGFRSACASRHAHHPRLRRHPLPVAHAAEGRGVDAGADRRGVGRHRRGVGVAARGRAARGRAGCAPVTGTYVELVRNTPFIVQLFFIFFGLPAAGVQALAGSRLGHRDGGEPRRLRHRDHPRRHRGHAAQPDRSRRLAGA
jgi:hypothetical protein